MKGGLRVTGLDPAVKKETAYVALWTLLLSLIMQGVFLLIGRWDASVLWGNLGGAAAAIGNFFLLAWTVSRALGKGKPEVAARQVKATASLRLIGLGAVVALLVGVAKTNLFATVIPLLFPRIGIQFRPLIDRKRGADSAGTEGSELLD